MARDRRAGLASFARSVREMPLLELPREDISGLSYERFLREYALPRQPVIIEGVGAD